jgi:hypothetical protein
LHGTPKPFGMIVTKPEEAREQALKNKIFEEGRAKSADAAANFAKWHPLGLDRNLHVRLTVIAKDPTISELIGRLSTSTGLNITVAENLTRHDPSLGDINMKSTYAYTFMELIAERDLDDGHWVKTDDGYRLEGISRAMRPPSRTFPWGWIIAGSVMVLFCLGFGGFYYRRKRASIR